MSDLNHLMQQARKMQEQLAKVQEEQARQLVTGESGAGLVKVTMNGKHEAKRVQIDPSVPLDDREMIEDLVAAAINDASQRVEQQTQQRMASVMGGLNLPPGFKLPF